MRERVLLLGMFAVGASIILGAWLFIPRAEDRISPTTAFTVPGNPSMTVDVAHALYYEVAPALLLVVYDAFGKTGEDDIYSTLETVTTGDALEYLYLERVGAMAGGGLDEADQTIHEINLLDTTPSRDGAMMLLDASWQVIGTVGHAEHLHVRGNTYRADLTIAPIQGAWRITDFELKEVNRDSSGETFEAPEADG